MSLSAHLSLRESLSLWQTNHEPIMIDRKYCIQRCSASCVHRTNSEYQLGVHVGRQDQIEVGCLLSSLYRRNPPLSFSSPHNLREVGYFLHCSIGYSMKHNSKLISNDLLQNVSLQEWNFCFTSYFLCVCLLLSGRPFGSHPTFNAIFPSSEFFSYSTEPKIHPCMHQSFPMSKELQLIL